MHFFGRVARYLLWSISSIILFLLLVGLAKTNRNVSAYISFLDGNDWSNFQWSQPATWSDPFWQHIQNSGDIADMLSGDIVDAQSSGLDVYDPTFEADLNSFTDASGATEEYGFTTSGQIVSGQVTPDVNSDSVTPEPKTQLLNLIKQREFQK